MPQPPHRTHDLLLTFQYPISLLPERGPAAALLPRQLDLSVSLQAGSCDPADTGGMVPLARVPLPGSASTSASECPDLQGAVVVRSADAPFDANKVGAWHAPRLLVQHTNAGTYVSSSRVVQVPPTCVQ